MRPCRRGTDPPPLFFLYLFWRFLNHHFFNHHAGGCRHVLGVLQGLVCPYLNPHFYRGWEANLLVMLGMLAGHAGDVENDADEMMLTD